MSDLIHNLGIDWKMLIAQIINFTLLLFLLKKFAYTPILTVLNTRREKIEDAIARSKQVDEKMAEIETIKQQVLDEARKESEQIIKKAEEAAGRVQEDVLSQIHEKSERLMAEAHKKIEAEREIIFAQVKQEVAGVVVLAVEKVIGDVVDEEMQRQLTQQAMELVRNSGQSIH